MEVKILAALVFLLLANTSFAANYVLTIDGKSHEVSLDEELNIKVGDRTVVAKLQQKDNLIYETDSFSFEYPKEYSPSKSDLGDGIFQTAMMTPLGTVVMVQEYTDMDPTGLMGLMINEITKEEKDYGYKVKSKPISTTLSDGTVLSGKLVTSKYKGTDLRRLFYTYGLKDEGLFIMTQVDFEIAEDDEAIIDRFVDSLKITME